MSALFELVIHDDHSPKRRYSGLVGPKNDIDLNLVLRLLLPNESSFLLAHKTWRKRRVCGLSEPEKILQSPPMKYWLVYSF